MNVPEIFVPAEIMDVTWEEYEEPAARPLLSAQTAFSNYLDRTYGENVLAPWDWPAERVSFATQLEWEEEDRAAYNAREYWGEYRGL